MRKGIRKFGGNDDRGGRELVYGQRMWEEEREDERKLWEDAGRGEGRRGRGW